MEKRNMYIAVAVVLVIVLAGVAVVSTSGPSMKTFKQKGSDTMLELSSAWAEQFHQNYSGIGIDISGGGSGVGIQAFSNKQVDIAQASRAMNTSEKNAAISNGVNPVEFKVAIDGIAIVVHPSNTVTNLTAAQLRGIYNGTYTNWNQVGGTNHPITVFGRQSTSGTYTYFREKILLNKDYTSQMQQMTGNAAIVEAIKGDANAIGYMGIGYAKTSGISVLLLKHNSTAPLFSPLNESAVIQGKYELSRYLFLYTNGNPTGDLRTYMAWILDANKGQKVALEIGFYPLPADVLAQQVAKLG